MKQHLKNYLPLLLIIVLGLYTACASDNQAINIGDIAVDPAINGDGGTYFPDEGGNTSVCQKEIGRAHV